MCEQAENVLIKEEEEKKKHQVKVFMLYASFTLCLWDSTRSSTSDGPELYSGRITVRVGNTILQTCW